MARLFSLPSALLGAFILSTGSLHSATASDARTDTLRVIVGAIKEIDAADGTMSTTLSSGSSTENFVTYSYTSNATRNLAARLVNPGAEVPAGLEIAVTATAPGAGGTPTGEQTLSGSYKNLVTGIPPGVGSGIQIQAKATITSSPALATYPIQIEFALVDPV